MATPTTGMSVEQSIANMNVPLQNLMRLIRFTPAALRLSVVYIGAVNEERDNSGSRFEVPDYIRVYERKKGELSGLQFPSETVKIISIGLQLLLSHIKKGENGPKALEMINVVSFFAPSKIPLDLFSSYARDEQKFQSLVRILDQVMDMKMDEQLQVFSVDNLVQQAVRANLSTSEKEKTLERALWLLKMKEIDLANVHHAVSVWNHTNSFDNLLKKFHGMASDILCVYNSEDHAKSQEFGKKALEVLERSLGSEHPGTLSLKFHLTRLKPADKKSQELLDFLNDEGRELLEDHGPTADYLENRFNAAFILSRADRKLESLKIFREVYTKRRDLLGPSHPDTLVAEGYVAETNYAVNPSSLDSSLKTLKGVVQKLKNKAAERDHSRHLMGFQHKVGCWLSDTGELDEALVMLQAALETSKKSYGPADPTTMRVVREIGKALFRKGEFKKSLALCKEVYKNQKKALGMNHSETVETLHNIKLVESVLREEEEGDKLSLKAISSVEAFKEAKEYYNEGKLLLALSRLDLVVQSGLEKDSPVRKRVNQLKTQVLRELRNNYSDNRGDKNSVSDHSLVSEAHFIADNSASALELMEQGKTQECYDLLSQVLKKQKKILGPDHPSTVLTQCNLTVALSELNRLEESIDLHRDIIDKQKRTLGADHPETLTTQHNMAFVLSKTKKYREAYELFKHVHEKRKKILGPDDKETLDTQQNMAQALYWLEWYDEALEMFQDGFVRRKKKLGPEDPETLSVQQWVSHVLFKQEKYSDALPLFNQLYEKQKKVLGEDFSSTLKTKAQIRVAKILLAGQKLMHSIGRESKSGEDSNELRQLYRVINAGDVEAVRVMLFQGIDIAQITSSKGNTPLHIAVLRGNLEIVDVLLGHAKQQFDSDKLSTFVNTQTTFGKNTPLHVATGKGHLNITKSLLKCGAVYNVHNREGKTPAEVAKDKEILSSLKIINELFEEAQRGNSEVIKRLADLKGEEFSMVAGTRNNQGLTLVQVAVANEHEDIATELARLVKERL